MATGTYVSIITLNVNGLIASNKRHRLDIETRLIYMLSTKLNSDLKTHID